MDTAAGAQPGAADLLRGGFALVRAQGMLALYEVIQPFSAPVIGADVLRRRSARSSSRWTRGVHRARRGAPSSIRRSSSSSRPRSPDNLIVGENDNGLRGRGDALRDNIPARCSS